MEIMNVLAFMAVAVLLVISPGPNGVLIAKTVPVSGRAAGFANVGGFVAAFYVHGSLSILGISILLVQSAEAFFIFKMLGAAYLCWIGVKSLIAAWKHDAPQNAQDSNPKRPDTSLVGAFAEGLLTNILNPKVSIFYLAAFPQFMSPGAPAAEAYVLVTAHAVLNLIWFSTMVLLLAKLKGVASSQRFSRWLKSVTGAVFVGFGAKLALLDR